jgi:O-antigen biosynthesis protein WbqP
MPKFRSMRIGTPEVATHLLSSPETYITPIGRFLRSHSLDELPQLLSVIRGDMSFVGPRPALFNQDDLIALRTAAGVHRLVPGVTGWAQINGRDELSIPEKVRLEQEYLNRHSLRWDLDILGRTVFTVIRKEGVSH